MHNPPLPRRNAHLLSRCGLCLVVTMLCVVLAEAALRLTGLAPPLNKQYPGMVSDPILPFRPQPSGAWISRCPSREFSHRVRYNRHGLRDVERQVAKPDGVFRILGLGDSFTYGAGVALEHTYLWRVEELLSQRQGPHPVVEVIKAGIPRFFPEPERLLLEHYGLQFEPDLVLVGFVPNDVTDTAMGMDAVAVTDDGYLKSREARALGSMGHWLFLHSHLARGLLAPYIRWRVGRATALHWTEIYQPNGFHESDWLRIEEEYGRMVDLAGSISARVVIIHIPQRGPWGERAEYPAERLRRWAEAYGAGFIDTLPALRAAAGSTQLYWETDPHCTEAGYGVIAETICAALTEKNLIP